MVNKDKYQLASELNSIAIQSYLLNTGWNKINSKIEHVAIFTKSNDIIFREIQLPLNKNFIDYPNILLDTTKYIADIENRDYHQVLSDLLIAKPSDVLRIRLDNEDTKEGTISFEDGFRLLENAKMTIYTAACDEIQPSLYHKRLDFKAANQLIKQCRLGQTERGSFITSIICPFINESITEELPRQFTLFDNPSEFTTSFTRKVTKRIIKSIEVLNNAIENNELGKITNGLADVVISANFLESIVNLKQLNKESTSVEFLTSWSSLSPVLNLPNKIEVQKDFIPAIESIIDKMMPQQNEEIVELVGKISQVKAEPDASKRQEGEVTFSLIGEGGKSFNVKSILDVTSYEEACLAHKEGKNILIRGKLITTRRSKLIESPSFTIIEMPFK